jgi:hypothetical protein
MDKERQNGKRDGTGRETMEEKASEERTEEKDRKRQTRSSR